MMHNDARFEISQQDIPLENGLRPDAAPSRPLHELASWAPAYPEACIHENVGYTISNDESARYYDELQLRTLTPDFLEATNRVAVLVGEASLASALPMIPEETIILLDQSPEMASFMAEYLACLQEADTIEDWYAMMDLRSPVPWSAEDATRDRIEDQAYDWQEEGYRHAFKDEESFQQAKELARTKAIIPWVGDITRDSDMGYLGDALRSNDAHVTLVNLTNVLAVNRDYGLASSYVAPLRNLPVTDTTPIMLTGISSKYPGTRRSNIVKATGPFFGLDNLAEHGGLTTPRNIGSGASVERQYIDGPEIQPVEFGDEATLTSLLEIVESRTGFGFGGGTLVIEIGPAMSEGSDLYSHEGDRGIVFINPASATQPPRSRLRSLFRRR